MCDFEIQCACLLGFMFLVSRATLEPSGNLIRKGQIDRALIEIRGSLAKVYRSIIGLAAFVPSVRGPRQALVSVHD